MQLPELAARRDDAELELAPVLLADGLPGRLAHAFVVVRMNEPEPALAVHRRVHLGAQPVQREHAFVPDEVSLLDVEVPDTDAAAVARERQPLVDALERAVTVAELGQASHRVIGHVLDRAAQTDGAFLVILDRADQTHHDPLTVGPHHRQLDVVALPGFDRPLDGGDDDGPGDRPEERVALLQCRPMARRVTVDAAGLVRPGHASLGQVHLPAADTRHASDVAEDLLALAEQGLLTLPRGDVLDGALHDERLAVGGGAGLGAAQYPDPGVTATDADVHSRERRVARPSGP